MANRETGIQNRILLALSEAGCTVWRNETAGAWVGQILHKTGSQVTLKNARLLKLGLCKGSSDVIGIRPVLITQEMVGKTIGQFIAPEIKTKDGKLSDDQVKFCRAVIKAGGRAGPATSPDEALKLIS
ncbi:MAG: VRR-NUC domain-containing protein [Blastopirellula sp.]|nr:MAG: VRR-NUC domain-containing protein [Blastopirellula sp.]